MRQTIEQTRKQLLDTALVLLKQRGLFVGVTHVRLTEVVAEAGMTTGAAYRCWDDRPRSTAISRWPPFVSAIRGRSIARFSASVTSSMNGLRWPRCCVSRPRPTSTAIRRMPPS